MTPQEHQQVVDIARLCAHEYFDHYLTDVFPKQMDHYFKGHVESCPVGKKVDRLKWMVAGMSALVVAGVTVGELLYYWFNARPVH
jgi:hypothetical protein